MSVFRECLPLLEVYKRLRDLLEEEQRRLSLYVHFNQDQKEAERIKGAILGIEACLDCVTKMPTLHIQ